MAVSVASATWVSPVIAGVMVDVRVSLAAVFLIAFFFHPHVRFYFRSNWLDAVAVSLMLFGCVSDWRADGFNAASPLRLYGEILLPYFAGRFMGMRRDSAGAAASWFCGAGVLIGIGCVVEGYSGWNAWEWLFAPMDDLVSRYRAVRYELSFRAAGPTRHPIFLGVVLILLLPWSFLLICRSEQSRTKYLGYFGLSGFLFGIVSTVSRGPLVGVALAIVFSISIRWPKSAKWLFASGAIATFMIVLFWVPFMAIIDATESKEVRSRVIEVGSESVVYSGTRNRLWVWDIYGPLVIKGGPLGFGTEAVSSFPPNIPGLPASTKTRETLGIVDNSYLLTGLRFGWIGLSLFLILIFGSIATAIRLRRSAGMILYPDGPAFLTALASCLIGVSFVMLTVFSSFDFMFWVYFHCGVVAGLASLRDSMLRGDIDVAA